MQQNHELNIVEGAILMGFSTLILWPIVLIIKRLIGNEFEFLESLKIAAGTAGTLILILGLWGTCRKRT